MWRGFRELYLTADRRVLGLARIAFGLVLIYDLARRARVLELFYTNYGVLSNHYLLFQPQAQPQFSLLTALSTTGEATFAFGLIAFVYSLYTLGLCTRVAQLLALLSLTSLNARNLFLEDSGISTMIAFGTWSAFLPLGDRFSLDALRREAKLPNIRARVGLRNELRQPAVSLAVLALTLQIIAIYWLSAVQKTGATWRHGDAVHDVLWQNRLATPLSWWLAQHEPGWFSPFATRATLALEYAIPVLVLYASSRVARTLAFGLAVALHGAIALIMTLGPFPYAMLTLVLTCVPGTALVWLAGRIPLRVRRRLTRLHVHLVRALARYLRQGAPARAPLRPLAWMKLREACVACVMLAALVELTQSNQAFKLKLPQPEWLRALTFYPRLTQRWSMFAPTLPPTTAMAWSTPSPPAIGTSIHSRRNRPTSSSSIGARSPIRLK